MIPRLAISSSISRKLSENRFPTMKFQENWALVPLLVLALAVSLPSQAASILIERTDGQLIAEVIPCGAGELRFRLPKPGAGTLLKKLRFRCKTARLLSTRTNRGLLLIGNDERRIKDKPRGRTGISCLTASLS